MRGSAILRPRRPSKSVCRGGHEAEAVVLRIAVVFFTMEVADTDVDARLGDLEAETPVEVGVTRRERRHVGLAIRADDGHAALTGRTVAAASRGDDAGGSGDLCRREEVVVRIAVGAIVALEHPGETERRELDGTASGIGSALTGVAGRELVVHLRAEDVVADDEVDRK